RLAPPARRTLLEERAQALLPLVARAALGNPPCRLRSIRPLSHEPLRPTRCLRPRREELGDDDLDRRVEILRDLVHEADPARGLGVEPLAGHEVAARCCGADP